MNRMRRLTSVGATCLLRARVLERKGRKDRKGIFSSGTNARLFFAAFAAFAFFGVPVVAAAQDKPKDKDADSRRPKITLKAQPTISMAPSRVVLTAELTGGANDYEEYYCPTVEWDWGDGTQSESTIDCEPFQAGKSEIKRRYTVEHIFRTGAYKVMFRLKRRDKALAAATVSIQVRPGLREGGM